MDTGRLWNKTSHGAQTLVRALRTRSIGFLAAAVAYYAFVSIVPLLLLALAIGTTVGGEAVANAAVAAANDLLAPAGETELREAIMGARGRTGASLAGIALLSWSSLKLFRGLDHAFSRAYNVELQESFLDRVLDAVTVAAAMVLAIVVAIVIGGFVPARLSGVLGELVTAFALPVALTLAFLPMYYRFPDVELGPLEALPGAAFAAIAWSASVEFFRIYAAGAGQYELYGVLGGVLLLVTWLYVAAIVIILGAILNAVLAGRVGGVDGLEDEEVIPDGGRDPDEEVARLRGDLEELREHVEDRTVHREELETELRHYVRQRVRRGHASGWGPYLVLLYGTAMTIAAFYFLSGGWAILAMLVIWLSTLGLYTLMVIVGLGMHALRMPGRLRDAIGGLRR